MTDALHTWGNNDGAIYFSADGGHTWDQQFYHEDYGFSDVFFIDSLTGWFVGWQEVMKASDGGQSWTLQDLPNPNGMDVEAVYFINPDTGWISASYKMIYVTFDSGENWLLQHNMVFNNHYFLYDIHFWDSQHGCTVGGMLLDPYEPIIMTTDDGGLNWQEFQVNTSSNINDIDFINMNEGWLVISDSVCGHTVDGGETWDSWRLPSDMLVYVDFINSNTGFIHSRNSKMFRIVDGGKTWVLHNQQFPYPVNIAFNDSLSGWLTDKRRIYLTEDGGVSWVEHFDALSSNFAFDLYDLAMLDSNYAWICTMDGWVFSLSLFQGTEEIKPPEFIKIYPNPVTSQFTIELSDQIKRDLKVSIFSVDGKLMTRKEYKAVNNSRLTLDLSGYSQGLYIVKIQGEGFSDNFKLLKE